MTRDDIIRMARDAGFSQPWTAPKETQDRLERFAALVAERDTALLRQALSTLEGWANYGKWVWPESALEQAKRNTEEAITPLRERLEGKA